MQLQINGSEDYFLKYRCFAVAKTSFLDTKKHHKIFNWPVNILSRVILRVTGTSIYFHCCAMQVIVDIYENTYKCHIFVAALDERNCCSSPGDCLRSCTVQDGRRRIMMLWLLPLGYHPSCNPFSLPPFPWSVWFREFWASLGTLENNSCLSLRNGSDW